MLTVKACSEAALSKEWSKQDFHSPKYRKYISYDNHPLFKNV